MLQNVAFLLLLYITYNSNVRFTLFSCSIQGTPKRRPTPYDLLLMMHQRFQTIF